MLSSLLAPRSGSDFANADDEGLKIGSRCRLSALGCKRLPGQVDNICTVVGSGKTKNQIRVKFDDSKTPQTLHRSYLDQSK
jgi:hypothetical protein